MNLSWCYDKSAENSVIEQIIQNRDIKSNFFKTSLKDIPDFSLMKDLKKAAKRILQAVENREKIMIYGHDDVDGITSTFILYDFLKKIGSQNHYSYIPNRLTDNHGIQKKFINKLKYDDVDLLIAVDGGVVEFEAVKYLQEKVCDVIITDHHIIQKTVPKAFAVVNPKQKNCKFPFDMIAGVGVTYFLVQQMASLLKFEVDKNYLFWVACGTIADKVPLVGINRIFVKEVINNWFSFDCQNIKNLEPYFISAFKTQHRIKIIHFVTRLFSNGRIAEGKNLPLEYLLSTENDVKEEIIKVLFSELHTYEDQLKKVKQHINEIEIPENSKYYIYVDNNHAISVDFMGFSANIISKKNSIPTIIIQENNGILRGEARCPDGYNLVEMFSFCQNTLIQFGGHKKAAGFTMKKENLESFKEKFGEFISKKIADKSCRNCINIDANIKITDLPKLKEFIDLDQNILQPFGQGNPNPVFLIKKFQPKQNTHELKIKDRQKVLNWEDYYSVVVRLKNNFLEILDYRPLNYAM